MEEVIATSGLMNFQPPTVETSKHPAMAESQDSQEHYQEEAASHSEEEDYEEDAQRDGYYDYDGTQVEETPRRRSHGREHFSGSVPVWNTQDFLYLLLAALHIYPLVA
jgi:hypothetical protein